MTKIDDARRPAALAAALLDWYDHNARRLPWRAPPGDAAPPAYAVWLSEIMLQQTTAAAVGPYFERFMALWPTVEALAAADRDVVLAEWAGLGYYARARNLHACAQRVAKTYGGRFPDTEDALKTLPGVGPYTAAAIAAIAFGRRAAPVDGNFERVLSRLYDIDTPLPASKPEIRARAEALTPEARPGDFAQAMMDLGATLCAPKRPACGLCPWRDVCAGRRAGRAETLPRKTPKAPKPTRFGVAFVACDGAGRLLLRKRPERGLLGGMLGFPGCAWTETPADPGEAAAAEPFPAPWRALDAEARHVFTHFNLRLSIRVARLADPPSAAEDVWLAPEALAGAALPTLMRKVAALALPALEAE